MTPVAAGVLRRVTRRRALGLFMTETYVPAYPEWGWRVRGRLGSIVQGHQAAQAERAVDEESRVFRTVTDQSLGR
jgi:hypothetical protein